MERPAQQSQDQTAAPLVTAWVQADRFSEIKVPLPDWRDGEATLSPTLEQATDSNGTNAKDVSRKVNARIVRLVDGNKEAWISYGPMDLDTTNGFSYVRALLSIRRR